MGAMGQVHKVLGSGWMSGTCGVETTRSRRPGVRTSRMLMALKRGLIANREGEFARRGKLLPEGDNLLVTVVQLPVTLNK